MTDIARRAKMRAIIEDPSFDHDEWIGHEDNLDHLHAFVVNDVRDTVVDAEREHPDNLLAQTAVVPRPLVLRVDGAHWQNATGRRVLLRLPLTGSGPTADDTELVDPREESAAQERAAASRAPDCFEMDHEARLADHEQRWTRIHDWARDLGCPPGAVTLDWLQQFVAERQANGAYLAEQLDRASEECARRGDALRRAERERAAARAELAATIERWNRSYSEAVKDLTQGWEAEVEPLRAEVERLRSAVPSPALARDIGFLWDWRLNRGERFLAASSDVLTMRELLAGKALAEVPGFEWVQAALNAGADDDVRDEQEGLRDVHWVDEGPYRRFTYRDSTGTVWVDVTWCGETPYEQRTTEPAPVVGRPGEGHR